MQKGGKDQDRDPRQAVAHAPDDSVNKPFRLQLDSAGYGKIEQFHDGLIDGVAEDLVASFQEHNRSQSAQQQQAGAASEHDERKHEQQDSYPKLAQTAGGRQQLQEQRKDGDIKIEISEEDS